MVVNRSTSAANWSALAKTSRTACCNSTGRWDTAAGAAGAAWICGSLDALWFLFVCVCCFFLELMIFGSLSYNVAACPCICWFQVCFKQDRPEITRQNRACALKGATPVIGVVECTRVRASATLNGNRHSV